MRFSSPKIILISILALTPFLASAVSFPSPIGAVTPQELIGRVIRIALGLVGSLALVMFIYGGALWMTAAGNEQRVEKGKNILVWATLGLMVIFGAYIAVNFVLTQLEAANK